MNLRRILRLCRKELMQTLRDPRMIGLTLIAPVFQLFLFGYAVSTDVNQIALAVLDEDHTAASRALVASFVGSDYFTYQMALTSDREMAQVLDAGQAQLVVRIPRGYMRALARGQTAPVQTILDGTDAMTARIIAGYTTAVLREHAGAITLAQLARVRGTLSALPSITSRVRVWYNPELKSVNYMVPGVLCLILLLVTSMMTALSIVKEKELGTLEQLVVTPITAGELMLGKTLPFFLLGMVNIIIVLGVSVAWFQVEIAGSIGLLFALSALFLLTTLGLGIYISTVSQTQHEATLTTFFFFMPSVLLSGFMFPVENMPAAIQWVTYLIPLRYFLEIIRGIFLKGLGGDYLWPQILVLAAFGVGILTLSALRFHKRLG
jgi:ABC-2 type transport system permease protein